METEFQKNRNQSEENVEEHTAELVKINEQLQQEITDRKRVEAILKESEERYHALYDLIPLMYFTLDTEGTILTVNQFGLKHLGYEAKELIGKPVVDIFYESDKKAVMEKFNTFLKDPTQVGKWDFRKVHKDGHIIWVQETVRLMRDSNNRDIVLIVCEDITERKRIDEALQISKERYEMAMQAAKVGVWDWNLQTGEFYLDPNIKAILGYADEEIPNDIEIWTTYVHPDDKQPVMEAAQAHIEGRTPEYIYEHRMLHKDGSVRWIFVRGKAIRDAKGNTIRLLGTDTDITERKQAEEALRQANLVVENSPAVLFRWKAVQGWPVELVSENVIQFGYTSEELLSGEISYASLVHPDDLERVAHEVQKHSGSGVKHFQQEYRIITKDGRVRWVDDRTVIERDTNGQITHYQGIVINITERKLIEKELQKYRERLEEIIKERTAELTAANEQLKQEITERTWIKKALLESEKQYRGLFENAIIGIYKTTPDGKIVVANPTLVKMLGYSSFEELAEHNLEKEKFTFYERSLFKEMLEQDGEIIGLESKWIRKDGNMLNVVENTKAIRDKNGKIIHYEGTVEDITKQKKLEANIQELREELVHVSRVTTMGEIVASLAHEINQPLTAILSNIQAAQRFLDGNTPNLDEVSEILSDVVKDNKRAVEVITRLRALLKKDVINFRPLDINEVIKEIISFVQSDMIRKNVAIVTELVANIPLILGDRVQIQQVILNLIMNGAEAMADTEPAQRKLIIRTEKQDEQNVKVAVQDLGTGFNVDTIEHMFDPFYTTKPKGIGMGLWISRSIIEVHKGFLQAENNSDKGATFWFVIPAGKLEKS